MTGPDESPLSEEAKEVLAQMEREIAEAKKQPGWDSVPITNPDKYSGPIGADDTGRIRTYRSIEDLPPKADLVVTEEDDEPDG